MPAPRPAADPAHALVDRGMVRDALALIDAHGEEAAGEAARAARNGRNQGNVHSFCRWRQIERFIRQLEPGTEAARTIH